MGKGKRYDNEPKLNYTKVFAVAIAIIVLIIAIIAIKNILTKAKNTKPLEIKNYFAVYQDEKWGILGSDGEMVIEPMYQEMPIVIDSSKDIFLYTYDINEEEGTYKTKVINSKNEEIWTKYDKVESLENYDKSGNVWYEKDVLKVQKDGKWGLITLNGNEISEIIYDDIKTLKGVENSIIVEKDGNIGLLNNKGIKIADTEYSQIFKFGEDYKNGYITVNKEGKYGIIDFNKAVIFENKYANIKPIYSSNKYAVKIDKAYKIIDKSGNILLDRNFEDIKDINDSNIIFKENGKYGVTTINSENKIGTQYEDIIFMDNNRYIAKKSKYGVINLNNEVQLDFKYDSITYNTEAGILIAKNSQNQYDIFDSTINLKLTVDEIEIFDEYMTVAIGEETKSFNFKFEEKEQKPLLANNDIVPNEKDGKYGFVNSKGNVIVKHEYEDVTDLNKYGFAGVKKDGLWGVVNAKGEIVIKPTYNLDESQSLDFVGKWHKGIGAEYYTDMWI